jgi:2'-5' RNA ligase
LPRSRLFLAFIPDAALQNALIETQAKIQKDLSVYNVRWEDPSRFHMTIRFLGDVNADIIEPMINVLDRVKFSFDALKFRTDETGFFPDKRFPNVVYAGLKEAGKDAPDFIDSIDKILLTFGLTADKKFVPHITLGRFNKKKRKKLQNISPVELPGLKTDFEYYSLMKSTLKEGGSVYEEIYKFNFNK